MEYDSYPEAIPPAYDRTGNLPYEGLEVLPQHAMYEQPCTPDDIYFLPTAVVHSPETTDQPADIVSISEMLRGREAPDTLNDRHPDWPPITLTYYFGMHGRAGHAQDLGEHVRSAQVYCYEHTDGPQLSSPLKTYAEDQEEGVEALLDRTTNKEGASVRGMIHEDLFRAVHGTGVVIGHFDLSPAQTKNFRPTAAAHDLTRNMNKLSAGNTFDETLDAAGHALKTLYTGQAHRDIHMIGPRHNEDGTVTAGNFEDEMGRIFAAYPHLKARDHIQVVASMGATHEFAQMACAAASGVEVRAIHANGDQHAMIEDDIREALSLGQQPTREQLARFYMESVTLAALANGMEHDTVFANSASSEPLQYARTIAETVDIKDIAVLHDVVAQGCNVAQAAQLINITLTTKGLPPLARSYADMRPFIAAHAAAQATIRQT